MRFCKIFILFILFCLIASFASGKIAFEQFIGFSSVICITDEDGKNILKLTEGTCPSWSSDGSILVFLRGQDIYFMAMDNEKPKRLGYSGWYPLISPDGKKIAYYEVNFPAMWLNIVDIDGQNQRHLTKINSIHGKPHSWSPDSKHIAYCDNKLKIINIDTLECKEILCTKPNGKLLDRLVHVDWSPKGDKFVLASEKIIPNPQLPNMFSINQGIWTANLDGSNAKRLTEDNEQLPEWSPDGTRIAFVIAGDLGEFCKIYIMNTDGSDKKRLTESQDMSQYESNPSWYEISFVVETQNNLITTWGKLKSK